jgi:hypothetical protein
LAGAVVQRHRRVDLLDAPFLHTTMRWPSVIRLDLVVGDVDHGGAEPALQARDLGAGLHAQLGVEVGQRLVQQEHLRLAHDARGPARRAGAGRRTAAPACGRARAPARASRRLARRALDSSCGTLRSFSANAMFSATVMCGYSA